MGTDLDKLHRYKEGTYRWGKTFSSCHDVIQSLLVSEEGAVCVYHRESDDACISIIPSLKKVAEEYGITLKMMSKDTLVFDSYTIILHNSKRKLKLNLTEYIVVKDVTKVQVG